MESVKEPRGKVRLKYLDIAKGIAVILVIISHSYGIPFGLEYYLAAYYMPLFFLISGYTYKNDKPVGANIKNRFFRLLKPYAAYNALLLLLFTITGELESVPDILKAIGGAIYSRYCLYFPLGTKNNIYFFNIDNGAMWFLTAMFCSSVIFYLVIKYCLESKKKAIIICTSLIAITFILNQLPILLPWSIDTAFIGAFFMIIGCYLGRNNYFERKIDIKNACYLILIFLLYILLCYINPGINMSVRNYGQFEYFNIIFFIIIGISGSLICIWLSKFIQKIIIGKFFEFVGKNTIVLVALHIFTLSIVENISNHILIISENNKILYLLYGYFKIFVVVVLCILFSMTVEHIKQLINKKYVPIDKVVKKR